MHVPCLGSQGLYDELQRAGLGNFWEVACEIVDVFLCVISLIIFVHSLMYLRFYFVVCEEVIKGEEAPNLTCDDDFSNLQCPVVQAVSSTYARWGGYGKK